eukprot:Skav216209  [mRNA]  locus=scaffold238:162497:167203:+ [translate_table: standard]
MWSSPVPCHTNNAGSFRGKAMGVATISSLPLQEYPTNYNADLRAMSRILECIVHLGTGVHMYVANIYGPTAAHTHTWAMLEMLCTTAFSHAHAYRGPALVVGDMNCEIEDLPGWKLMRKHGWVDAAQFDADRRGVQPQPTCRSATRRTFILINPVLLSALESCEVSETFDFDAHPLLLAKFGLPTVLQPRRVWTLPSTTNDLFFDGDLMLESVTYHQPRRAAAFSVAKEKRDTEEMLRQTNLVFESCLQDACVTTDGHLNRLPQGCLGRCRKKTFKYVPASTPVIKHAREGHFNPTTPQATVSIRRRTRQVRRLQSLYEQLARSGDLPNQACKDLWQAILHAPGYHKTFQDFALNQLGIFVPAACPSCEYVHYLTSAFRAMVQKEVRSFHTEVLAKRQEAVLRDIKQGGSHAFASVRDPQQPPYQSIHTTNSVSINRQRWTKTGLSTLLITGDCSVFDVSRPVYFQDQERFITHYDTTTITFDHPVRNRNMDDVLIWQQKVVANILDLQKETAEAWSDLWQRDDPGEDWASAINALNCFSGYPEIQFEHLTVDEWKRHASQASNKSARGACGYTPRELIMMPAELTQWLLDMLETIEDAYAQWPAPLMIARVVMLAKSDKPPDHPLHTRPITITSRLYRNWARYRALQIISVLAYKLPPSVAGSMAGVSADLMAAALLDRIETAHITNEPVLGCTVDLVKCYNMVPRRPILLAMAELGIPIPYLTALEAMFAGLQRVLEISGQVGDPQSSTTGIPEGCCFSIVAMMTLSAWIHHWLQQGPHLIDFAAYADNWTLTTETPDALQWGINRVLQLVSVLDMKVAPDKSWTWASHAKERRVLRKTVPFPVRLVATELGCGAAYCKRKTKVVAKQRLAKTKRVLQRIRRKKIPRIFKVQMANQLSASLLGYGSEVTYYTHSEFKSVRAACCKAVGRACNPFLSMFATGDARDPELALLIRKCFFWRRFMRSYQGRIDDFHYKLQQTHGKQSTGPVGVFVRTLRDHGWSISPEGFLLHERGWKVDWLHGSKGHLVRMLTLGWNVKVCRVTRHRKHFAVECMDVTLGKGSHKVSETHKPHVISWTIGRHVTNDALVHYAHGTKDNRCSLCGCKDGRYHRVLECPKLQDVRTKHAATVRWLQHQSDTTVYFGILPLDLGLADQLLGTWESIPDFHTPVDEGRGVVEAFTDGSALYNTVFFTTCAAGAFVIAEGHTVADELAQHLPGQEQSSYRGEVWGLILLLSRYVRVHVHADCAAMLKVLQQLLVARRSSSKPGYSDHIDLWSIVWDLLQTREPDAVSWTKVKAHSQWQHDPCPTLQWQGKMNAAVDTLARKCAHASLRPYGGARQRFESARKTNLTRLADYHVLLAECSMKSFAASDKARQLRVSAMPTLNTHFEPARAIQLACRLTKKQLATCPLGSEFADRLCKYFHGLRWDPGAPSSSLHELLVDFMLSTNTMPPVHVVTKHHHRKQPTKEYLLPDLHIVAAEQLRSTSFATLLMVWRTGIRWLVKIWDNNPLGPPTVPCTSLHKYGYVYPMNGFPGVPAYRAGQQVLQRMWQYLHPGGKPQRSLTRCWG